MNIHLVVTSLCDRNCEFCCNKKYDIQNLQYASDEEFLQAKNLYLTGGEPFVYANPNNLAKKYKELYPNIEKVIVYTNAKELAEYLCGGNSLSHIDGVNVSIKDQEDFHMFTVFIYNNPKINNMSYNRLYDFTKSIPVLEKCPTITAHFKLIDRSWQKDFVPAENCLFRRGN